MSTPTLSRTELSVNVLRGLAIDGTNAAKSGHPGLPMGAAAMAYAIWKRHLKHNPKNPKWFDRDRFILSAGHGSMLLYGLLNLAGYDLPMEELRNFRQLHSKTPGHPENVLTPGVEMATGPLGQGFAHGVGMAIAERFLAATYNRPGHTVVDHFTYAICSDGDLMEGITNEAASLAGHLGLGKLIYLYDDNGITIDGSTEVSFTEDVAGRFAALGWQVLRTDGMDVEAVDAAIREAKTDLGRPTLILCKTTIGYGSPNRAGTAKAHGAPLGEEEGKLAKVALGLPADEAFWVPDEVRADYDASAEGAVAEATWTSAMAAYAAAFPAEAAQLKAAIAGEYGSGWVEALPAFTDKAATRKNGEAVLNALAPHVPTLLGGSADLAESTFTHIKGGGDFQASNPTGRNLNFGVREHAMGAAVNGMTLHGGVVGVASTFLIFSDYCRPSIRLAALMEIPSIYVFTHDSIGLGEDGPTHQPVEHLAALRAIPNCNVIRPCDGNETAAAWKVALEARHAPTLMALSRQALPVVSPTVDGSHPLEKGGYVLAEASSTAKVILVASGSEVAIALAARDVLEAEGTPTRVVSLPSWHLFEAQPVAYRHEVLPPTVPTVSVEAATTFGWARYAQAHVGLDRFGVSAPADAAFRFFGLTPENVADTARKLLG